MRLFIAFCQAVCTSLTLPEQTAFLTFLQESLRQYRLTGVVPSLVPVDLPDTSAADQEAEEATQAAALLQSAAELATIQAAKDQELAQATLLEVQQREETERQNIAAAALLTQQQEESSQLEAARLREEEKLAADLAAAQAKNAESGTPTESTPTESTTETPTETPTPAESIPTETLTETPTESTPPTETPAATVEILVDPAPSAAAAPAKAAPAKKKGK